MYPLFPFDFLYKIHFLRTFSLIFLDMCEKSSTFALTNSLAMVNSSFIVSPLTPEFSDVWSEPQLLSAKGHNAIYAATRFGRKYILKALAEHYRQSTPHVELLRKEFSIGVSLDHPNIVRLLDFGHMDSIGWYIQMEYIDGITLEQFLETKPSATTRRQILFQLLDALSFLHERQIIHRDIKPSNILITRNGSAVKLIDFGVSDTDDYVTFKQPAGSMAYIAPEQLEGKTIDNRADIYAVGKIIALLFPHQYKYITRRCTRFNPTNRYSSCARVARSIKRADRLRIDLPLLIVFLLTLYAVTDGAYSAYQRSEQNHLTQDQILSAHIDSLRAQNDERQHSLDSLNRLVDSLAIKTETPSPRELVHRKAASLHLAHQEAIRQAVQRGEIKTLNEARAYDGGLKENFEKTERSIKDPVLHEEFMQAYFSYFNMNDAFYDSIDNVLNKLYPHE